MKIHFTAAALVGTLLLLANCKTPADLHAASRAKYVGEINAQLKGRGQVAVDSVFQNLKVLGGFPAENLVFAMEKWSQALGVDCSHCHNTANWASDEKPQKDIARQMVNMGETLRACLGFDFRRKNVTFSMIFL